MTGSWELMIFCLLGGSIWVFIVSLLYEQMAKRMVFASGLPPQFVETSNVSLFVLQFLIDALFFVAIPTLGYGFFAIIFPLAGVRPAMAAALALFAIGMLPSIIGLTSRVKLSFPFLLLYLCANFLKLAGSLCLIGYLYSL